MITLSKNRLPMTVDLGMLNNSRSAEEFGLRQKEGLKKAILEASLM